MAEQRDQWGETADERAARINARDLARMVYEEGGVRDGVGRLSGGERLAFDAGYAAGRADYLHPEPTNREEDR